MSPPPRGRTACSPIPPPPRPPAPAAAEAAVIGVPHPHWGETVKAVVVLAPGAGLSERELIAFSREDLAHYKCPTSVEFVASLPRTATGKVQKFRLREQFAV